MVYRFGPFTLDSGSFALCRNQTTVQLPPKLIDLLLYLVGRPATVVTKDELFKAIWPDVVVTDNALTQAVSDLRQALGDRSASPTYVQTVAKRGYRFIAPVEVLDPEPAPSRAHHPRETSNLDATRAFTEGRLQLESLDRSEVVAAVENFKRAIALDPGYAAAYIGLANAHFWLYEMSRHRDQPDTAVLARAIEEAECAVQLDAQLGEAHATLAYLLAGASRMEEARAAARRAIALDPEYWAHHFRLGNAAWGEERLAALARCLGLYPEFPFAYLQMAMVHVARNALELAAQALRTGAALQDGHPGRRTRFPANGLHWMFGLIQLRRGDQASALALFDREVASGQHQLYATEFSVAALNARGFTLLQQDRADEAAQVFERALGLCDDQTRARLGLAAARLRQNHPDEVERELQRAGEQVQALERAGRRIDAATMRAGEEVARGRREDALRTLQVMLREVPPGSAGWVIPIDPLFAPLRASPGFDELLMTLAARAR